MSDIKNKEFTESDIKEVIIIKDDDSQEVVTEGVVIVKITDADKLEYKMNLNMLGIGKKEMQMIMHGFYELTHVGGIANYDSAELVAELHRRAADGDEGAIL